MFGLISKVGVLEKFLDSFDGFFVIFAYMEFRKTIV